MDEMTLTATPVLGGYRRRFAETWLSERDDLALISVACPLGEDAAFAAALKAGYGLRRPSPREAELSSEVAALQLAPDQIMLVLPEGQVDLAVFDAVGYVTQQTDAWVILDLEGPLALPALERLCPLDLHRDAFGPGSYGRTMMEHMSAVIWQVKAGQYRLMSASSSARSFLHAVETSLDYVS